VIAELRELIRIVRNMKDNRICHKFGIGECFKLFSAHLMLMLSFPDVRERPVKTSIYIWPYLMNLIKRCDKTHYVNTLHNERDKGLLATLFETGERLREALLLRKRNFELVNEYVLVKGMRVLKRYRKVSGWTNNKGKKRWKTEPDSVTHGTFPIRIHEPLTPFMMNWVKRDQETTTYFLIGYPKSFSTALK